MLVLLPMLAAACGSSGGAVPGPGDWIELFPGAEWNDFEEGTTEVFTGVLRFVPGDGLPSYVMRYNPYKLETADGTLDVYCGGSDDLSPWVGLTVSLEGRIESMNLEGVGFIEIWPSRLVPAGDGGGPE